MDQLAVFEILEDSAMAVVMGTMVDRLQRNCLFSALPALGLSLMKDLLTEEC